MTDTARDQAIAQVQNIVAMVAAYEADYERLEELRNSMHNGGDNQPISTDELEELAELDAIVGECESQEDARECIQDDPLSVEYRSGWTSPGEDLTPEEFRIVLCTGGPHVEIVGDCELSRVRVLYRGWGDSGELFDFDRNAVVTYCSLVGIGE